MKTHGYAESDREGMRLNYLKGYHNAMTECARTHPGMDTHPDCPKCKPHRPAWHRKPESESESESETESYSETEIEIKRPKAKTTKAKSSKAKSNDNQVDQFVTPADEYVTAEVTTGPNGEVIETHTTWQPYLTQTYHNGYGPEQEHPIVPPSFSQVMPPGNTGGSGVYFRSANAIASHNVANQNVSNHYVAEWAGDRTGMSQHGSHNVANQNVADQSVSNHTVAEWAGHRTGMSQHAVALQKPAPSMEHPKARILTSKIQSSTVKPMHSTVVQDSSHVYQLAVNQKPVNQWNSQILTGQIQSSAVRPINSTVVSSNKYLAGGHALSTNHNGGSQLLGDNLRVMEHSVAKPINATGLDSQILRHNYTGSYLNTVNATGLDSSSRIYQNQTGPANYTQSHLNTVNATGLDSSSRIYQSQIGPANYTQSYLNMQKQACHAEPGLGKGSFFKSSVGNLGSNHGHRHYGGNFFIFNET